MKMCDGIYTHWERDRTRRGWTACARAREVKWGKGKARESASGMVHADQLVRLINSVTGLNCHACVTRLAITTTPGVDIRLAFIQCTSRL